MTAVFLALLAIIIFDFIFLGFIDYSLKLRPKYRHLLNEGFLINDNTCNLDRSWNGKRYQSLILTKKHLILKNNFLTSVKNIDVRLIEICSIKKKKEINQK